MSTLYINRVPIVTVYCENYAREPVIGRCTKIHDDKIQVVLMKGSYNSTWRVRVRDKKKKKDGGVDQHALSQNCQLFCLFSHSLIAGTN